MPQVRFVPDVAWGLTAKQSSWFVALVIEVSAIAASRAAPARAKGNDGKQTGAIRKQKRAGRPTGVANAPTGNDWPVSA